jgi:membrane-bound serine protease (ClpP class)
MTELIWPMIILAIAIALLFLEVFLPSGGILGILSALAFAASIGLAFTEGGLRWGTIFMGGTALLIPFLIALALRIWPKTPFGKMVLNEPPREDETMLAARRERMQWIGQRGYAVSAMLPAGAIRIGNKTMDAISDGRTIEKGAPVEVVAVRGAHIVVKPASSAVVHSTPLPSSALSETVEPGSLDSEVRPEKPSAAKDAKQPWDAVIPDPFDDSLP